MDKNSEKLNLGELFDKSFIFKEIEWRISNVLSTPTYVDCKVQTPSFTFADATWKIETYPYGQTDQKSEGYIDFLIERLDSRITEHDLFFKFFFKGCSGKKYEIYSSKSLFNFNSGSWGVNRKIDKSRFISMNTNEMAPNNVSTFICEMRTRKIAVIDRCPQIEPTTASLKPSVKKSDQEPESSTCKGSDMSCHPVTLSGSKALSDLKELFLKQEDCDVTIRVKEQEFPAHRIILKARSPVFASTFRNDMKEKATGVIDIEDCDPSSFSDFLCFLYCGNVKNLSTGNVFSLFTTADKYDVQDLRSECMEFIKKNLSVDTFCETITLAHQHSEKELIELATGFFAKNLQEIIVTVKWQSFLLKNPIQGNELLIKSFVHNKK